MYSGSIGMKHDFNYIYWVLNNINKKYKKIEKNSFINTIRYTGTLRVLRFVKKVTLNKL